jgi:hypothetical protein
MFIFAKLCVPCNSLQDGNFVMILRIKTKALLLGEDFCGVSCLFSWWKSLQLGFGLIILGEVSRKSTILFM